MMPVGIGRVHDSPGNRLQGKRKKYRTEEKEKVEVEVEEKVNYECSLPAADEEKRELNYNGSG